MATSDHGRHDAPVEAYHYTECGLPNVWLTDGVREIQTEYGPAVAIDNVDGLHRAIARALVAKPGELTPDELRFLRLEMDMSQRALGELLAREEQTVSLWERKGPVPADVGFVVRHIVQQWLGERRGYVEMVRELRAGEAAAPRDRLRLMPGPQGWTESAA